LFTENGGANDTADAASSNKSCRAESAFPLAADVVRLPGEDARDVGVAGNGSEENAEVANAVVVGETEKW